MKKKKIYKVIIVGLGKAGSLYNLNKDKFLSHAEAVNKFKNFKLLAGVDINKDKANIFEKKYNIKSYLSIDKLVKREKFDIAIVAVPTILQYKTLKKILTLTKNKVILCEKPCTNNLRQIKKIRLILGKRNSKCFVNYQRVSLTSSKKIKNIIFNNKKVLINVSYSNGLLNSASHYISLFISYFGNNFKIIKRNSSKLRSISDFSSNFSIIYPNCKINFKPKNFYKKIHGTLEINIENKKIKYLFGGRKIYQKIKNSNHKRIIKSDIQKSQLVVYKELYKEMLGKKSNLSSIHNAIKIMSIIEKVK